ncbi:MAG: endonuclease [Paludibacteraceae bacterium]|nr:endonuclease [Paludibacteraceae bacterium]
MRNIYLLLLLALMPLRLLAAIDMQAHVACDEGKQAYTAYTAEQNKYYTGTYAYSTLITLSGDELFGRLNQLMGNTCKLDAWGLDYGDLRYAYVDVDRDLNRSGYIIGYYDGKQLDGDWGSGWNREHTWPQSKGAKKETTMGHDMQSVRPTNTSVNSSRGNTAYGESGSYYDPDDEISINNSAYKKINLGTYRGDAARVILYDYLVYGQAGSYKNGLYNGNAQLLSKLGTSGVFESIRVLLKWHMQDPPSLTEMVRNDGAQDYQGNRNPMIDFPELAIEIFADYNKITRYNVTYHVSAEVSPRYMHTLSDGFITYLTSSDGSHPANVEVKGAKAEYDASLGRLIISNVTGNVTIGSDTATSLEDVSADANMPCEVYNISGKLLSTTDDLSSVLESLSTGLYIIRQGTTTRKVSVR